jgi:hypothetical protein
VFQYLIHLLHRRVGTLQQKNIETKETISLSIWQERAGKKMGLFLFQNLSNNCFESFLRLSKKKFFWTVPDFLMNKPLPKALKVNFYAVFGSLASQKLHTINPLVPSAD